MSNLTGKFNQLLNSRRSLNYEQILTMVMVIVSVVYIIVKPGIAALGVLVFALLLPIIFRYPKVFLFILIAGKMLINAMYNVYIFGDVNILKIIGVFVPSFLIMYMLIKKVKINSYPFYALVLIFLAETVVSTLITLYGVRDVTAVVKLLRLSNGFACYFAIPLIFESDNDLKLFFKAWLTSISFPVLIGLYQIYTGQFHFQVTPGVGAHYRISGFYHDIASIVYPALILILIIFFYFKRFQARRMTIAFYVLLGVSSLVIYRTYSRWGTFALAIFLIVFSIYYRRRILMIVSFFVVFLIFFSEQSGIYKRFEHEAVITGKFGDKLRFTGRYGIWQRNLAQYINYRPLYKLFGYTASGNPHNDFLRILLDYGLAGLILFVALLVSILIKLYRNIHSNKDFLTTRLIFIAFLSHLAYIAISFGLTPSLWTDYQWFHWGLVGMALKRIHDLEKKEEVQPS